MEILKAWNAQSRSRSLAALALAVAALFLHPLAMAQADTADIKTDTRPWVKPNDQVKALSGDVFGDAVNLSSGTLSFSQTDVSIPGNSDLPLAVTRTFSANTDWNGDQSSLGMFGDWELDLPRMEAVFADPDAQGASARDLWVASDGLVSTNARCSKFSEPPVILNKTRPISAFFGDDYFSGVRLHLPGEGSGEVLKNNLPNGWRPALSNGTEDPNGFPLVTRGRALIKCPSTLTIATPQHSGEGFEVLAPNGTVYRFNWMQYRPIAALTKPAGSIFIEGGPGGDPSLELPPQRDGENGGTSVMPRVRAILYPTQITDRFGHTITFNWNPSNPAQLNSIVADDNRTIAFSYYSGTNRIRLVTVGARSWEYVYSTDTTPGFAGSLVSVKLPDQSSWIMSLQSVFRQDGKYLAGATPPGCLQEGTAATDTASGWLQHPSGAKATFALAATLHTRSSLPACDPNSLASYTPPSAVFMSITQKLVEGVGFLPLQWTYKYDVGSACWGTSCSSVHDRKRVTIKGPDSTATLYEFGKRFKVDDGKLLLVRQGKLVNSFPVDSFAWLSTKTLSYYQPTGQDVFPNPVGSLLSDRIDAAAVSELDLQNSNSEERDGVTYVDERFNYDKYGYPTKIIRSNSAGRSKTEVIEYQHFDTAWVLGQTRRVRDGSVTGTIEHEFVYDSVAKKPSHRYLFGRLDAMFSYYTTTNPQYAGLLSGVRDGANKLTQFNNYYRGRPQELLFHDNSRQLASVNTFGEIESMTDELGYTTNFQYDNVGRLKKITHPAGDTTVWAATDITFAPFNGDEYGISTGHWKQSITTGRYRKETIFDALWRPVVTREWDANLAGNDRFTVRKFDADGRETFTSYPKASLTSVNESGLYGVRKAFDALGRLSSTVANSELGDLTTSIQYGPGKKTITNPRLKSTTIEYLQYDVPSDDLPIFVVSPEKIATNIVRDVWGKPQKIERWTYATDPKTPLGAMVTRSYFYDANQRLCKTKDPERGAEVFNYDSANRIAWTAAGAGMWPADACENSSNVSTDARILRTYDSRDRLTGVNYPGSTYDETRAYYADGALQSTTLGAGQVNEVRWDYLYNKRRMPTEARIYIGGQSSAMNWTYNELGHLADIRHLNGFVLKYTPNAYGQPTQVYSTTQYVAYASGISYYPNGALKQFTYGNGVTHQMTQNLRQLPLQSRDWKNSTTIVDHTYQYDQNGNPQRIDDALNIDDKWMVYDELDRLDELREYNGGPIKASMDYDAFDNLTRYQYGSRNWSYLTDAATQRVTALRDASTLATQVTYQYDGQGNISRRKQGTFDRIYSYDAANHLTSVRDGSNRTVATHIYDALGRRTRTDTPVTGNPKPSLRFQIYTPDGEFQWENDLERNSTATGGHERQVNYIRLAGSLIAKQIWDSDFTENTTTTTARAPGELDFNPFRNPYENATVVDCNANGAENGNGVGNGNGQGQGCGNAGGNGNGNGGGNTSPDPTAARVVYTSIEYVHTDALGSPIANTPASGTIYAWGRTQYEPYGLPLNTPRNGAPSYTGHQYDRDTGLVYAQQRYYDPMLGRFHGIDPMAVDTNSAFNFNRYAYANNSPYKFTDPDGRCPSESTTSTCIQSSIPPSTTRTVTASPEVVAAATAGKGTVKLRSGSTTEKLGSINRQGDGSLAVKLIPGVKTATTSTAYTATGTLPANAEAVIHGHPRGSGLKDERGTLGDAGVLASVGKPNIAVGADGRMAVHELENGTYQVRALDGEFTKSEIKHFEKQVDNRQEFFNENEE